MNNQQSQSPCIVLSQHRGDGERELKFEVKTEECVREIRPLGFVIEFWLLRLESRPISACFGRFGCRPIRPDMAIRPNSSQINPVRHESSRVGANPKKKKSSDAALTHRQPRRTRVWHPPSRVCAF